MQLEIYRGNAVITSVEIDERSTHNHKLMNENEINVITITEIPLIIQIGDYVMWDAEPYFLNRLPVSTKKNTITFEYTLKFEGLLYNLYNQLLFSSDGLTDFSYTAQAYEFLQLIIDSINEIDGATQTGVDWTVGTVDPSDDLNIDFAGDSCRTALTKIAEAFKFEFSLVGKEISLKKTVGRITNNNFEYGRGKGLYTLSRDQVSDQNVITRVWGFGGTQNITEDYRNRAKRLIFEDKYLEKNVGLYGLKVGRYINEEIYPKRTSTLTDAHFLFVPNKDITLPDVFDNTNSYIEDSALDFDLNGNKIEGSTPKIVFKSGDLAGNEFEVWKYDHTNKRMYINPYSEPDGYTMPNATNHAHTGDSYTLVGIKLPQSYVDAAEDQLQAATQTFLNENSVPQVIYSLEIDPKYVKTQSISVGVGDIVHIKDVDLGVDNDIRISELSYPLVNRNKISATIADFVPYTIQQLIMKNTLAAPKKAVIVGRKTAELARIASMRQNQLKNLIFDPDNYFDLSRIKPLSIETMYLKVGSKSQNLKLSGITFTPNVGGDPNAFEVSSGDIVHMQYSIPAGNTWDMLAHSAAGLTPNLSYYLYAKCSKTQLTGVWQLTTEQKYFEDPDFYYFWTGILYDVQNGLREFEPVTGMIVMNGGSIKAGRLQSVDGAQYFDLDNMKFFIGDDSGSLDWNVTEPNKLTIHGAVMTDILISSIANIGDLLVNCLRTADAPNARWYINEKIAGVFSNAIVYYDFENEQVISLDGTAGADENISWRKVLVVEVIKAGFKISKGDDYTKFSKNGVRTHGPGYTFKLSDDKVGVASAVLEGTGAETVEDYYATAVSMKPGDSLGVPSFAHIHDGDVLTMGVHFIKGNALLSTRRHDVANMATVNMPDGYTLFTNCISTQDQVWILPDPSLYSVLEEIEIINVNSHGITLVPLAGDKLGYFTGKKAVLDTDGGCCKLRSNGVDKWLITSLTGNLFDI